MDALQTLNYAHIIIEIVAYKYLLAYIDNKEIPNLSINLRFGIFLFLRLDTTSPKEQTKNNCAFTQ